VTVLTALALVAGAVAARVADADDPAEAPELIAKHGVRFYPKEKRIEMDGQFCLPEGPIELLACARGGKEYESVITLDVEPKTLHFCLVLMGLKPGESGPRFQGDPEKVPTGNPVTVRVRWTDGDEEKEVGAEELCWNIVEKAPMGKTPWVFVGSRWAQDEETGRRIYVASIEKTVLAVYWDPFAVLDLPLASGANDEAFAVNKDLVPKPGTACTVVLRPGGKLPRPPKPPAEPKEGIDVTLDPEGRPLIDGVEVVDFANALRSIAGVAPGERCRVRLAVGTSAGSAARVLESIAAAGLKLESVETAGPAAKGLEELVVRFTPDAIRMRGVNVSVGDVAEAVAELVAVEEMPVVALKAEKDTPWARVAEILDMLAEFEDLRVHVQTLGE